MDPSVADSLQAVRDTVVIVQAQSNSWLDWVSLGVSVLIAGFTGGYLWYTMGIFEKTEKQAEAAQESAEASRKSLEEQRRVNQQRRIERSHPLVWVDFELTQNEKLGEHLHVKVRNGSNIPAMGISGVLVATYSPSYCDWQRIKLESEVDVVNLHFDETKDFGFRTVFTMGGIESNSTTSFRFKYPVLPESVDLLFQYQDIHENHYGRIFWAKAVSSSRPRPGDSLRYSDEIEDYTVTGVIPHGIREMEPVVWKSNSEDNKYLLLQKDSDTDSPKEVVSEYIGYNDEFVEGLSVINGRLPNTVSSFLFPPFKATVHDSRIFPTYISQVTDNFRV